MTENEKEAIQHERDEETQRLKEFDDLQLIFRAYSGDEAGNNLATAAARVRQSQNHRRDSERKRAQADNDFILLVNQWQDLQDQIADIDRRLGDLREELDFIYSELGNIDLALDALGNGQSIDLQTLRSIEEWAENKGLELDINDPAQLKLALEERRRELLERESIVSSEIEELTDQRGDLVAEANALEARIESGGYTIEELSRSSDETRWYALTGAFNGAQVAQELAEQTDFDMDEQTLDLFEADRGNAENIDGASLLRGTEASQSAIFGQMSFSGSLEASPIQAESITMNFNGQVIETEQPEVEAPEQRAAQFQLNFG